MKEGLVVLIPKTVKPTNIQEYRPISLLNFDYKIITKSLKRRTTDFMQEATIEHQTCAVQGRCIINTVCAIRDVIS